MTVQEEVNAVVKAAKEYRWGSELYERMRNLIIRANVNIFNILRNRELRKPSMSNELKPFIWDDYVYNQALRGNGAEHFNRTWTSSTERIALEEW